LTHKWEILGSIPDHIIPKMVSYSSLLRVSQRMIDRAFHFSQTSVKIYDGFYLGRAVRFGYSMKH